MALILITGLPGTGKSTICAELKARGYVAYDADEDGLAHWYDKENNAIKPQDEQRTRLFVQSHVRAISKYKVVTLKNQAMSNVVFICGDPDNEVELYSYFTDVYALVLAEDDRQKRLTTRTNNSWGKLPHERERDLKFFHRAAKTYAKYNYKLIDATLFPAEIADFIVRDIHAGQQ